MWYCADHTTRTSQVATYLAVQSKRTATQITSAVRTLYICLCHHHLQDPSGTSTNNINSFFGHLHLGIFLSPAFRCCEGLLYIRVHYYISGACSLVLWSSSARTTRKWEPHMLVRRQPLSELSNLFPFRLTISIRFILRVAPS